MSGSSRTAALEVLETGPLATVQDTGRPGLGSLGIGRSGAADRASYALANRLLGNDPDAAALEVTLGGLVLRAHTLVTVVTTGARCPGASHCAPFHLAAGQELRLGSPVSGLRTYVGVRGGIDLAPVLGSRSTDLLSGLGPAPLTAGDRLAIGRPAYPMPGVDVAATAEPGSGEVTVAVQPGPRRDWFTDAAWRTLLGEPYVVGSRSNRIGIRLEGAPLERTRTGELPSEGMVRGAVQVPPEGGLVLFLGDHPVTGGYPVIGYVDDRDVDRCAQLLPTQTLRFAASRTPGADATAPGQ